MNRQTIIENFNLKLPLAKQELMEEGYIENIFGFMLSEEINVNTAERNDILVSLSLHFSDSEEGELKVVLVGIDNDGIIDLISVGNDDEVSLGLLIDEIEEIENNGIYTHAVTWGYMG